MLSPYWPLITAASHLIDSRPTFEQSLSNALNTGLGAMIFVINIFHHLFCGTSISRSEGLVPLGENEGTEFGRGILHEPVVSIRL